MRHSAPSAWSAGGIAAVTKPEPDRVPLTVPMLVSQVECRLVEQRPRCDVSNCTRLKLVWVGLWYTKEESDQCIRMTAERMATEAGFAADLMGESSCKISAPSLRDRGNSCHGRACASTGPFKTAVCPSSSCRRAYTMVPERQRLSEQFFCPVQPRLSLPVLPHAPSVCPA